MRAPIVGSLPRVAPAARRVRGAVALLAPVLLASTAAAPAEERPAIGLVLAGGGARGGAHVGVLRVMEELRVPVDYVAGTSMGSIVGGLYSSGLSPGEMARAFQEVDWANTLVDEPPRRRLSFRRKQDSGLALFPLEIGVGRRGFNRPPGIAVGRKIEVILRSLTLHTTGVHSFDDLRLPFRAVAADLDTGEAVVIDHGDLADAMRASMSIPGLFTPVEWEGRVLVDGGIADNLPVDVARRMGAERIIAIDVGTPPKGTSRELSALGVVGQVLAVLTERSVIEQRATLGPGDLLITPELGDISSGSFDRIRDAVRAGEAAAWQVADELRAFSVSPEEYAEFLERQRLRDGGRLPEIRIDEIEFRGLDEGRAAAIAHRLRTRPGRVLDHDALRDDLGRVYRLGEFEKVGFDLERDGASNRLVIDAREKSWGPGYLRFGLGVESAFDGDSDFRALVHYRRPQIDRLGAEWRSVISLGEPSSAASELFQPLHARGSWFVAPHARWEEREDKFFVPSGGRESLDFRQIYGQLDFGVQLANVAEIRAGARRGTLDVDPDTETGFEPIDADLGGWAFGGALDTLDSPFFPTRGNFSRIEVFLSREGLGASDEYDKASLRVTQVGRFGRNVVFGRIDAGTDFGSDIPLYDEFELGGFLNLSGLERGRKRGDVLGLATLGYYFQVFELGFVGEVYAGAAVQAGNVWDDVGDAGLGDVLYSGTVFVGADTPFSPVFLGFGLAEGGERSFYLVVGRVF